MTKRKDYQGIGKRRETQLSSAYGIDVYPGQVPPSMTGESRQTLLKLLSEHKRQAFIKEDFDRLLQHESQSGRFKWANTQARLKRIACYRGIRANQRLPLRGQRTGTNAQTAKRGSVHSFTEHPEQYTNNSIGRSRKNFD